jgi:hypothetical protein
VGGTKRFWTGERVCVEVRLVGVIHACGYVKRDTVGARQGNPRTQPAEHEHLCRRGGASHAGPV